MDALIFSFYEEVYNTDPDHYTEPTFGTYPGQGNLGICCCSRASVCMEGSRNIVVSYGDITRICWGIQGTIKFFSTGARSIIAGSIVFSEKGSSRIHRLRIEVFSTFWTPLSLRKICLFLLGICQLSIVICQFSFVICLDFPLYASLLTPTYLSKHPFSSHLLMNSSISSSSYLFYPLPHYHMLAYSASFMLSC